MDKQYISKAIEDLIKANNPIHIIKERNELKMELDEVRVQFEDDSKESERPRRPRTECVICLDKPRTHCCVPCGHKCLCVNCVGSISKCPICQRELMYFIKVYDV